MEQTLEIQSTPRKSTKRFECTYDGCGKSYTRAEHLARHQLNHNPKAIFKCDFPGCSRSFVRQDLCVRHRDRHEIQEGDSHSDSGDDRRETPRRVGRPRLASRGRHRSGTHDQPQYSHPIESEQPTIVSGPRQHTNRNAINERVTTASGGRQYAETQSSSNNDSGSLEPPHAKTKFRVGDITASATQYNGSTGFSSGFLATTISDPFDKSPGSVRADFTAWLFDENVPMQGVLWPGLMQNPTGGSFQSYPDQMFSNYFADPVLSEPYPSAMAFMHTEANAMSDPVQGNAMSHQKRLALIELMGTRFNDGENADIDNLRHRIFLDNSTDDDHVLSLRSMQSYIGSYWARFHRQLPILHQPTFSADTTHDLLLLAVMVIGAASLNNQYGQSFLQSASRFADFVAWHLRWQVFMHADFRPPAKLWVFQTLLLVEMYEKMYSTRAMHERAHIHSATTINLMRRGKTLMGDSADAIPEQMTPDEAWHRWIQAESMRRAAFAAFIVDSNHAVMFSHAAVMVIHELRLPLPCDDALWAATSASEVGRVQSSLHIHGIKPPTFLEGLKRTLTGRKVKTNNFGRTILMAGLLSTLWHLHQRDLQVSSLGASQSFGMPGTWREALTKAFDFWKRDLDESTSHVATGSLGWQNLLTTEDLDNTSSAEVWYHLSHMALNVEGFDVQIFAGAPKVFGRKTSDSDYERTRRKMIDWATSAGARPAVFHALQLLKPFIWPSSIDGAWDIYNCRDDHLLNRAWVMYHALLVLWSYGFALDGILVPFPSHLVPENLEYLTPSNRAWASPAAMTPDLDQYKVLEDAQSYFIAFGACQSPNDLLFVKTGRNRLVGLLLIFAASFSQSRWELLREGAVRLNHAVQILKTGHRNLTHD